MPDARTFENHPFAPAMRDFGRNLIEFSTQLQFPLNTFSPDHLHLGIKSNSAFQLFTASSMSAVPTDSR
jgi:hypothetical protein